MPERVVFTPTPEPLMQLCLECTRARCNGEKCDEYKELERKIRMNVRRGRQSNSDAPAADSYMDVIIPAPKEKIAPEPYPVSKMEIVPLSVPPHEAVARARGLKLWNITIEALEKLLDEEDMEEDGSFAGMLKALKRQRFELYGERVDWHALEDE